MILWIKKEHFKLQIEWLLAFKPSVLFDKINQLNWYENTLRQWVDDQSFSTKEQGFNNIRILTCPFVRFPRCNNSCVACYAPIATP